MKSLKKAALLLLAAVLLLSAGCTGKSANKDPVALTVWHYYNGAQQQMFDQLVQEFNETLGAEQYIVVKAHSQGSIKDLLTKVMNSAQKKVGAEEMPDIFAAYSDTAYQINEMGLAADLAPYLSEDERVAYIPGYLNEGDVSGDGRLIIFPVAKSTELLMLNDTAWQEFVAATDADEGGLKTWEGIVKLAEEYYRWTDSLTPDVKDDGKAFFGRDAFANYIIIGSKQLGTELFQVENGQVSVRVDRQVMRRLWDNYYVPYINGYFASYGNFRSDDAKSGDLIAMACSSSGASFFPVEVTDAVGNTTPIEGKVYELPNFEGTDPVAVQQGAGMVVVKSDEKKEAAAAMFLKWVTEPEQNVRFAINSGYLPVTFEGNSTKAVDEAIQQNGTTVSDMVRDSLHVGVEMCIRYDLYTSKAFSAGNAAREVVNTAMADKASADRTAVLELMAQGMAREEAVAQFNTEENFEAWLTEFTTLLNKTAKG